ncbi:hypothetical protein [Helicobacter brantae]|uniref:Uncharacterized protein n=1 Tax=Helicobacter brantae TaxID=375927 RepID=A0A3D8IZ07_9HELI|nr:hypothetical protein [Helicobacter brantae]RDU70190.1 hypothetical protein CQA58_06160 [Helicobacter brantae]
MILDYKSCIFCKSKENDMGNGIFFDIQKKDNAPEFLWIFCYHTHILQEFDILTYGNWEFYPSKLDTSLDFDEIYDSLLAPLKNLYKNKRGLAEIRDMYSGVDFITRVGEFGGGNHIRFYTDESHIKTLKMDICIVDNFDERLLSEEANYPSYLHYIKNISIDFEVLKHIINKIEAFFGLEEGKNHNDCNRN